MGVVVVPFVGKLFGGAMGGFNKLAPLLIGGHGYGGGVDVPRCGSTAVAGHAQPTTQVRASKVTGDVETYRVQSCSPRAAIPLHTRVTVDAPRTGSSTRATSAQPNPQEPGATVDVIYRQVLFWHAASRPLLYGGGVDAPRCGFTTAVGHAQPTPRSQPAS